MPSHALRRLQHLRQRLLRGVRLNPQFQVESDQSRTSEVEVTFIAESPQRTRVELEHRNLDRHGEGWEGERDAVGGEGGWRLYLERFEGLISAQA